MLRKLLLVSLARPATIDVRVDALALPHAQTEQLHGELMTRLVEEGHAVGTTAAVVVRLTGGGDVVHVEVAHGSTIRTRDVRGQGAVLRLAVIHAAIELLAGLEEIRVDPDPALAAAPERAVVVEVDDAAQVHAAPTIAAVVDAGWVVTPAAEGATRKVCLGERDGRPTLAVVAIEATCGDGAPVDALGPEVAVALRMPSIESAPTPEPAPEPAPEPEPVAAARVDAPVPSRSASRGGPACSAWPSVPRAACARSSRSCSCTAMRGTTAAPGSPHGSRPRRASRPTSGWPTPSSPRAPAMAAPSGDASASRPRSPAASSCTAFGSRAIAARGSIRR
jgi:hypothetical protein